MVTSIQRLVKGQVMINMSTYFKNPENPSCIEFLLTNSKNNFDETLVLGSGLSDFQELIVSVLKSYLKKKIQKLS